MFVSSVITDVAVVQAKQRFGLIPFFLVFYVVLSLWPVSEVRGSDERRMYWPVPVNTVAVITKDDQGRQIKYPSSVFYDSSMKEIYLIASNSRITVYGSDFGDRYFPNISLGKGRGITRPTGIFVARDGRLFVGQGDTGKDPARLTILNAAFFPLQEIVMADIPGAERFTPSRIALGRKGKIYLAGKGYRGVMVLDRQGKFMHWLKPEDRILRGLKGQTADAVSGEKGGEGQSGLLDGNNRAKDPEREEVQQDQADAEMASLPEALKPKTDRDSGDEEDIQIGPVQINDIVISEKGYIFLLSEETGKIYIYNDGENFLFSFGQKGGSTGKLSRPRGLAVDEERQSIFVVDYMRHSILVYNFAGRFLFEIGGYGELARWFNFPTDIALTDEGYLVVADLFNQRVQVLEVVFKGASALFGSGE